ncbi:PQQ-binding-like beta-propeller repeat protein [Candidatus Micrarchaeota archaeon]|nr:PQQ-binding-like beta-propeller repeat protein [Candidatus Micrarchaeota archaeon]
MGRHCARVVSFFLFLAFFSSFLFAASVKWSYKTEGFIDSSPILVGGTIYFGSGDGKLYALDESTGRLKWFFPTKGKIYSTPFYANGVVYFASTDGFVYAVNANNQNLLWNYSTGADIDSSPVVEDRMLYIGARDGRLYAIDADTGKLNWTFNSRAPISSTPKAAFGRVYFGSENNFVYALDAETGDVKWSFATQGPIWFSSPDYRNNVVFIGSTDGYLYALNAANGSLAWTANTGDWIVSSPKVYNNLVYVGSNNGFIRAFDADTGSLAWQYKASEAVQSSAVLNGDAVYFGSNDGSLRAFDAATGSLLWAFDSGDWVRSTPVARGNMIFFGSYDNNFYAVSSLSCSFNSPENDSIIFEPSIEASGFALGDKRIESVYFRMNDGVWEKASGTSQWSINANTQSLPAGAFTLSCKVADANRNEEPAPYTTLSLTKTLSGKKLSIKHPPESTLGKTFRVEIRGENNELLEGVAVSTSRGSYQNVSGFIDLAPSAEGDFKVNVSRKGYAPESFTIRISKDNTLFYVGGGAVLVLVFIAVLLKRKG